MCQISPHPCAIDDTPGQGPSNVFDFNPAADEKAQETLGKDTANTGDLLEESQIIESDSEDESQIMAKYRAHDDTVMQYSSGRGAVGKDPWVHYFLLSLFQRSLGRTRKSS